MLTTPFFDSQRIDDVNYLFHSKNYIMYSVRNFFFIFFFTFVAQNNIVTAQEHLANMPLQVVASDSTKTLLSNVKIHSLGLYVAPEVQYGQLAGDFTGFRGGSLMLIANKKFAIGASVFENQYTFAPSDLNTISNRYLSTRSAGLRAEYSFAPYKLLHISIPVTFGYGQARVDSLLYGGTRWLDGREHRTYRVSRNSEQFFFIQPAVQFNLNILKYAKWYVGAGYRLNVFKDENNAALFQLSNAQLSGISFQTGLKLGIFGINLKRKHQE